MDKLVGKGKPILKANVSPTFSPTQVLWAAFRMGVYRHECAGVYSTKVNAGLACVVALKNEPDNHHDYDVIPFLLDVGPKLLEPKLYESSAVEEADVELTFKRISKFPRRMSEGWKVAYGIPQGDAPAERKASSDYRYYDFPPEGKVPGIFCPQELTPESEAWAVADWYEEHGLPTTAHLVRRAFGLINE